MALMTCPECGESISDKAEKCIHCGFPIISNSEANPEDDQTNTQQVEITSFNIKGNNLKKTVISVLIILAVVLTGIFAYNTVQQKSTEAKILQDKKEYAQNLSLVRAAMIEGASEAEHVGKLMGRIWYNAIYEEYDYTTDEYTHENGEFVDDFNTALFAYQISEEYEDSVELIEANQVEVTELIKKLQSPPDGLEKANDTVTELHETYLSLCKNATDPSGNLGSYSDSVNTNIDRYITLHDKLETQIPEFETIE